MIQNGLEYLNSRLIFGMMPGLASTRKLCEALGNPQKKFKTIHVVGTNGKGSTSYYLSGVLQAHGLKTGLYTSPHLVSMRERIRVNDLPIDDESLDRLIMQVKAAAEETQVEPTFFEVLTIVAFLYYAEQNIDVAVLEAGMGGRLDSTAVADGELIVLTSIGLEHTEVLGSTESAILKEKMGVAGSAQSILSNGRSKTFVLGGLNDALIAEAKVFAASHGCSCVVPEIRNDIELPNLGQHYIENASLSLKAAELFLNKFDDSLALKTLTTRSWAGRMQKLIDANGVTKFILDGAHNSHAVRRLVETLDKYYPNQKFHCVFGALRDKDVGEMLKLMAPHVSAWHITRTPYPRFRELEDLQGELEKLGLNVASAGEFSREYLNEVCASVTDGSPVLITGSLYMIGATVQALKDDFDGLAFFRGMEPTTNEHR
ncbi:dihydrofolate synthase [Fibrobacter succinogenes subsp. succinogenes S85]|uniref:Dihydrofolate synthase/folylpolyglutamate synthase n=1 Tax=Fibrobacter succinogenes (strain ATCC 19169 / S85) TaxID=59374 RepID=C9RJV3_FIBSS|nr:cyanophycin synthetase [Fibrobacter succinogenes]ACX73816.1 FolC bifunctional protein [Fibrobacter succinogenes subsp. succinogenes S85]ADL27073.1 dihydrofolate synthase [Fibrobacter succinogenes subsp. succinogenes S85]